MEIQISLTTQIRQYEPLTVTVKESAEVNTNEDYQALKKKVSACLEDIVATETEKYRKR